MSNELEHDITNFVWCSQSVRTPLLTYFLEQSPFWEAKRFSASQEITRKLWNPKVHYHSHKCPPPVPTKVPFQARSLLFDCFAPWYRFYAQKLLAHRPNPKLEEHPLSAVHDCLFNIFAATLHIRGRSSICKLRTRHAMETGTHLSPIQQNLVWPHLSV